MTVATLLWVALVVFLILFILSFISPLTVGPLGKARWFLGAFVIILVIVIFYGTGHHLFR